MLFGDLEERPVCVAELEGPQRSLVTVPEGDEDAEEAASKEEGSDGNADDRA